MSFYSIFILKNFPMIYSENTLSALMCKCGGGENSISQRNSLFQQYTKRLPVMTYCSGKVLLCHPWDPGFNPQNTINEETGK